MENLKASITDDPGFMWDRPILAMADGTVYAGNQRLQACIDLGWATVPAILADIPERLAHERALRDNNSWGEWDDASLIALIRDASQDEPDRLKALGFTDDHLQAIIASANGDASGGGDSARPPSEFGSYDDTIATDYCCPSCGYGWSGRPK